MVDKPREIVEDYSFKIIKKVEECKNDLLTMYPNGCEGIDLDEYFKEAPDLETCELLRDNFVEFSSVRGKVAHRPSTFVNAAKYASYRLLGYSEEESYRYAFPSRYLHYIKAGMRAQLTQKIKTISRSNLVLEILRQHQHHDAIIHRDKIERAIELNAEWMEDVDNTMFMRQKSSEAIMRLANNPDLRPADREEKSNNLELLSEIIKTISSEASKGLENIKSGTRSLSDTLNG